jgi:hypothetical protein
MSPKDGPRDILAQDDPELESTDGGWDPYVASLLLGDGTQSPAVADEEDSAPVMSLSPRSRDRSAR